MICFFNLFLTKFLLTKKNFNMESIQNNQSTIVSQKRNSVELFSNDIEMDGVEEGVKKFKFGDDAILQSTQLISQEAEGDDDDKDIKNSLNFSWIDSEIDNYKKFYLIFKGKKGFEINEEYKKNCKDIPYPGFKFTGMLEKISVLKLMVQYVNETVEKNKLNEMIDWNSSDEDIDSYTKEQLEFLEIENFVVDNEQIFLRYKRECHINRKAQVAKEFNMRCRGSGFLLKDNIKTYQDVKFYYINKIYKYETSPRLRNLILDERRNIKN